LLLRSTELRAAASALTSRHRRSATRCGSWKSVSCAIAKPYDAQRFGDCRRLRLLDRLRPAIDQIAGALEIWTKNGSVLWPSADLRDEPARCGGDRAAIDIVAKVSTLE